MKKQVLILNNPSQFDPEDEKATIALQDKVDIVWRHVPVLDAATLNNLRATHPTPDILVTSLVRTGHGSLQHLPGLEAIIATSTATDYIDLSYCRANNIKVFNTPRYTGSSVAEHAFALIMACTKQLRHADASLRTHAEGKVPHAMELADKRLGIIGLGEIGGRVAHYAACFGMEVVYYNRSRKAFEKAGQVGLDDLLITSDIVVMTVPLNEDSFHLIGQRELNLMRKSAFLVNIGADELIQMDHLVTALQNHQIAGAALDVITEYDPYLAAPNLILTQSRGWYTKESVQRRMAGWINTLEHYLQNTFINRIL